jgi:DNA-binding winged helix-turn-helix (wHTH) protein
LDSPFRQPAAAFIVSSIRKSAKIPIRGHNPNMEIRFGSFRLDVDTRQLLRNGQPIHLTPKAFDLLSVLVGNRPKAMSKTELTERIWPNVFVADEGLPRLINEIRMALGDAARDPRWIRTVHGFGYAFAADADGDTPHTGSYRCRLTWSSRDFQLSEGEHVIGRDPAANVCLKASVVSRRHARIVVGHNGSARLEDLRSKNGTFVGATRLNEPHVLSDGEEIRVGDFTLTFHARVNTPTETLLQ